MHAPLKTLPDPLNAPGTPVGIYLFLAFPLPLTGPESTVSTLAARDVPLGVPLTPLTALFCITS
jgi:hypothetical protein